LIYLEDHQIVDAAMYEDINSLLSAGEVPGLFTPQEMEPILAPLKEAFGAQGPALGCRNVLEFFVHRVRSNLHVVLSMDPGITPLR
jgi:dynein heavy chain 2